MGKSAAVSVETVGRGGSIHGEALGRGLCGRVVGEFSDWRLRFRLYILQEHDLLCWYDDYATVFAYRNRLAHLFVSAYRLVHYLRNRSAHLFPISEAFGETVL